ncbi:MAG: hypothetical protein ABSB59_28780 [Streptosporangiaceae bacterium]|jgi:hypothetical protein
MNREGAETCLRRLAEAAMRRALAAGADKPGSADPGGHRTRLKLAGQALLAVGALDPGVLEEILVDFNLAMGIRLAIDPRVNIDPATRAAILFPHHGVQHLPMAWAVRATRSGPRPARTGPEEDEGGGADDAGRRFVPVGLTVPFRDSDVSGELYLMSFARTRAGMRFFAVWNIRPPAFREISLIPFGEFTVTDDRGARYHLVPGSSGDAGGISEVAVRPGPPPDARWLDITAPGSTAVRVGLRPADPAGPAGPADPAEHQVPVGKTERSPGELLLVTIAERLLTAVPDQPRNPWRRATATAPPVLRAMAAGLGDIVAVLEAADVLSPLSPVPGRLATLCASLDIPEHGITAPPAPRLPETWLSVLAHYQRRKPDPVPLLEGYAAMTAALPELDGIQLTLLGLHHTEGGSSLHVLVRGELTEAYLGPFGVDPTFPLSIWLRDSGGRWHVARPAERHHGVPKDPREGEWTMRLQLVPPLTRATPWAEVQAGGQTTEVRATVPLRWGYPS